ncbi:17965_t:CDS:1 [Funneliformis caledonium]|uniref:Large ribosomal subunit protein uL11m n=2 Tax=Funneliformis TaxID=1117308 RepID=A0A9N8V7I6_9GLOM|nr:7894_t:CDS:1 [Funneliformis mosseae]CAG8442920.1 17965_t:CDS:1 [Funneliformis caledonium]
MGTVSKIKILVPAGKATPTPPIGPALGQRGVKAIDFCKQFNELTKNYELDTPIPTIIQIQPDRKFTFMCNMPPTAWLLKRAARIEKGAAKPKHEIAGRVSLKHIYEIAKIKQKQNNMKNHDLKFICKSIVASAGGIGIEVVP